jgi:tetratricopeptide (TPR) repeat protein
VKLAEENDRKSLTLHKENKEVYLALLDLYEKTGQRIGRNGILEEIIAMFPDDKESLLRNGEVCVERKAYLKGIEYIRRAARLGPLDRRIKESLSCSCIRAALSFAKKRDVRRSREFMKETLGLGESALGNFNLGLPYLRIRLALFEWIAGNDRGGDLLLE